MAKSILVLSDINESGNCALNKAHEIAAPLGEQIEVVRFVKMGSDKNNPSDLAAIKDSLQASIDSIFADYPHKENIINQVVVTDDIISWVNTHCENNDFDLVVKAGHRSETFFHTPCDWELIRTLQVPVLIASQQHWRNKHAILAAVNPDAKDDAHKALNDTILQWSKKWALTFGSSINVVYSLPVPNILKELDIIDMEEYAAKHRAEGEQKVAALIEKHGLKDVNIHITAGAPDRTIPHCANELKAELVIMGSTGKSGLKNLIFGNITEKVMHNLRTDSLSIELENL